MPATMLDERTQRALADLGRAIQVLGGDEPGQVSGRRDLPSDTPTTNYMTGPGGIFGVAGLDAGVIHTMIQGFGLANRLPAFGSMFTDPLTAYITGVQDATGNVADGVCDDPQEAGLVKNCIGTTQFGRTSVQSKVLEVDRLGQRINRGEFNDLRLVNSFLMEQLAPITPSTPGGRSEEILRDVIMAWMPMALYFQRKLGVETYTGNPANNSAGGGTKEFAGIDILISTGHVDVLTNTACPSLDSDIKDFNYACVGADAATNANLVVVIRNLVKYLKWISRQTGLEPVTWAFVMRPDLFYELTAIWACAYLTDRCMVTSDSGERVVVDAGDAISMRDNMRNGSYLLIDGMRIEVIQDTWIPEETNVNQGQVDAGSFASDIYLVPLTILGGMPALYWEYLNYDGENGAMSQISQGNLSSYYFTTDGGRFLWHNKPPNNWCVQWLAKIEPRIRLLTPQLAGRIQNVCYSPLQHVRDANPGDPYFVDGGATSRSAPSYYSGGWLSA